MSAPDQQSRSELIRAAADLAKDGGGEVSESLLHRYYRHVATDDLLTKSPEYLLGVVRSHRELAKSRKEGTQRVRVFHPVEAECGWTSPHTVIEIVTDDMPFLVDSVTAELAREDHLVQLLVHPQLVVRRDDNGELVEVRDVDAAPGPEHGAEGCIDESWMHLQVDRVADEDASGIEQALEKILSDVRRAVSDWSQMRAVCEAVSTELGSEPPSSVPDAIVERTRGFLDWLVDDHFTFLGYREYVLDQEGGEDVLRPVPDSGLGLLRSDQKQSESFSRLTPQARATAREPQLLIITKANSRATVHRSTYLDYVGIKVFDDDGQVVGEKRFLGLFTSSAYTESVRQVPIIRERVAKVLARAGFTADSHSGKDLLEVLESYPRDELFQTSTKQLYDVATTVLHLQERRKSRMFLRRDEYGRFVSCLIYIPRDRYNTSVRLKMEQILREAFGGASVDYTTRISESALAQLHFVVRVERGAEIPDIDEEALQQQLVEAARTWEEDLGEVARREHGDEAGGAPVQALPSQAGRAHRRAAGLHRPRRQGRRRAPLRGRPHRRRHGLHLRLRAACTVRGRLDR